MIISLYTTIRLHISKLEYDKDAELIYFSY